MINRISSHLRSCDFNKKFQFVRIRSRSSGLAFFILLDGHVSSMQQRCIRSVEGLCPAYVYI